MLDLLTVTRKGSQGDKLQYQDILLLSAHFIWK